MLNFFLLCLCLSRAIHEMNGKDHEGVGGLEFLLVGLVWFFNKYTNSAQEFLVEGKFNKLHLMHDKIACHVLS